MLTIYRLLTVAALILVLSAAACGGRETNAPDHTIVTGYITRLDEQVIVVAGHTFETANVTIWSLNGHRRTRDEFSVGMYVQVVASKLPPFETWVATQPEPR